MILPVNCKKIKNITARRRAYPVMNGIGGVAPSLWGGGGYGGHKGMMKGINGLSAQLSSYLPLL